MAFGTSSKIFTAFIENALGNDVAYDLDTAGDTFYVALYNNTNTPSQTVTLANTVYNVDQWATGEVYDGAEWPQAGQALSITTSGFASNVFTFDAADEVSTGTSASLTDCRGCLVYDNTLSPKYGLCYLSFGGAAAVTDGTFTVVFNGSGIFTLTLYGST